VKLIVEDRTFDKPTEQLITSGLAVLPREQGVAVLEDGDNFLQTRRQGDEFEVEYRDGGLNRLFETPERFDLEHTTKLFHAYFRKSSDWSGDIRWGASSWNSDHSGVSDANAVHHAVLNATSSYENPELAVARANIERLKQESRKITETAAPPAANDASVSAVRCSRCGSDQIMGGRQGYGAGKGVAGLLIAGPIGLVAGLLGRKKVIVSCLSCGHTWRAGSWFR
jgi:hypothetical protein